MATKKEVIVYDKAFGLAGYRLQAILVVVDDSAKGPVMDGAGKPTGKIEADCLLPTFQIVTPGGTAFQIGADAFRALQPILGV